MRFQVVLPNESAEESPERIAELAVAAERLGYDTVYLPDHLLPPGEYGPPPQQFGGVFEPLVTLAYLAARTERIRLSVSVLVLPLREPILVAKQFATLDRLSGGRATLGIGVGWNAEEFASVGADFRTRGARTDEALGLIRRLFTTGRGPGGGVFEPRPAGHVPFLIGGRSDAALRRAAKYGDSWQGVGYQPEEFADRVRDLRALSDRPVSVGTRIEWTEADDVEKWRAAGADELAVWFGDIDGSEQRMAEFASRFNVGGDTAK
jgi:probable F420-dependent oxidoreductase